MPDASEYIWLKQIEQGEHTRQEFKFRIDSSREIAKTLCAFANSEGGTLWIGVKDNRKIAGCNPEEEFHMIAGAARLYCVPEVKLTCIVLMLNGKQVLKCDVPVSQERPHYARIDEHKNRAFIRHNDFNAIAGRVIIKLIKQKLNPDKKPEVFRPDEMVLINVLKDNSECSVSKLSRLSGFPVWRIENLLVKFIRWELIKMHIHPQGITYSLVLD